MGGISFSNDFIFLRRLAIFKRSNKGIENEESGNDDIDRDGDFRLLHL